MRKRRAFADKELESIMLEREYKERELLETGQAASAAASLFLPGGMVHAAEYNSYKAAFSSAAADHPSAALAPPPKELCGFLPGCLDLSVQYAAGPANVELISSNVSVATTYRQYPLTPRFLVWPRSGGGGGGVGSGAGGVSSVGDALLYQQCLLNATAMQNLKPGAVWEPMMMASVASESHSPESQDAAASKLEGSRAAAELSELQQSQTGGGGGGGGEVIQQASLAQVHRECSAFSPPKRGFSQVYQGASTPPPTASHHHHHQQQHHQPHHHNPHNPHEHVLNKLSKHSAKHTLSMKLNPFHSLIQQTLSEKSGAGRELRGPCCKDLLEEAARKYRESAALDELGSLKALDRDRLAKDFIVKSPIGTKVSSSEMLSFSVEAILKRPSPSLNRTSQ
ncbi:doublesex- and mab-3-related transcription factor 2a isoform X2 [Alosa sapidissima]|nr:doublesex- and mab-3-related transcription factor 2a isoform X2 [Alosa sapidissima]